MTTDGQPVEYNIGWWRGAARAATLRCPRCGRGKVFRRFVLMNETYTACELVFDRGVGYWLGAMMFNMAFGFVAVLAAILFTLIATSPDPDWDLTIIVAIVVGITIPIGFFPFSRTFWIAAERPARLPAATANIGCLRNQRRPVRFARRTTERPAVPGHWQTTSRYF